VNHFFNIKIPGSEHRFISEIILDKFGRIPKAGEEVEFNNFKMVVEKATPKKIEKVRIIKS
jgi:CBS domain containing-hemolysin-like protein